MKRGPTSTGRVVYVSYDGLLEPLGCSQILPYVNGLAGKGFPMTVVSFEKPADLLRTDRVADLADALRGRGIEWNRQRYHRTPALPATAVDVARAAVRIRRLHPVLVHARSYVAALMGDLGTGRGGAPLLFDMRGLWIDERIAGRGWDPSSLKVRRGRRIEARLLSRAEHVVHLTHASRRQVVADFPELPSERHSTIPTSADLSRFTVPDEVVAVRTELGLPPEGPILVHSGTLGARYQAGLTMEVAKAFIRRTGGALLVLSGEGAECQAAAKAAGVSATVRSVDHREMPKWLSAADAGLALACLGPATVAAAPTKVGEYLATGLAVAATGTGNLHDHFSDVECSFVVPKGEAPERTAARLAVAAAASARQAESRALAERYYSLEAAVDTYSAIYSRLGVEPCA